MLPFYYLTNSAIKMYNPSEVGGAAAYCVAERYQYEESPGIKGQDNG